MPNRRSLAARYVRREALLEAFSRRGPRGVLFVETGRRFELAEPVLLTVEFPAERRSFRLQGKVISRRRGSQEPPLPPGVEVEFYSEENRTLQLVLDHAAGKAVDFVDRRSHRMPCSFVVTYGRDDQFVREFAEDISEGGSFIRTDRLFPVGTVVECKLKPPGYLLGLKLWARVAWVKATGQPRGMGLEFLFETERQRKKVRDIVQKLQRQHAEQLDRTVRGFKEVSGFRLPGRK
ncbi:MAG: TIGR02266 family protein [Myxococcales bacterium]|nr:TIGR02266 family protein [Myxococcales bacterium]